MLRVLSLVWGILSILGMLVAFVPCFGWLNWVVIPFALVGLVISGLAYVGSPQDRRGGPIIGLITCSTAVVFGIMRLMVGGGVF